MKKVENNTKIVPIVELCRCPYFYDSEVGYDELPVINLTEIAVVESGVGVCKVLGQEIPCSVGDVYIISPEVPHIFLALDGATELLIRRMLIRVEDWLSGDTAKNGNNTVTYFSVVLYD